MSHSRTLVIVLSVKKGAIAPIPPAPETLTEELFDMGSRTLGGDGRETKRSLYPTQRDSESIYCRRDSSNVVQISAFTRSHLFPHLI